ncbi:YhdH/YhfP family quinone oxidoreductase [Comamonas sp. JUb58]|uniref:YhdH/YhfP family quinone oxidoreductase n=1 Tax=Comamonas sp. JUb58 TaxID=2485114 RepID=UPI00105EF18B|nr:YhdH/YhfP family quinone oxidoreductase [Comamonas sp. JUb58]TDS73367.1 putative YhdH/YhfP family quinone oxidoreductase [Comamonas sp. JUb58]
MNCYQAMVTRSVDRAIHSQMETLQRGELAPSEVLVQSHYAGVNYKDCLSLHGAARIITQFPRVAGIEVVGEVLESRSDQFRPGDMVLSHGFQRGIDVDGGFAELVQAPAEHLQALPPGLSAEQVAILGVPGFTAAMALERFEELGLQPDSGLVAISGAGGAVGRLAIHMLHRAGYRTAALTRNLSNEAALRALGASEVIDISQVVDSKRPIEKPQFAAGIDNVGGAVLSWMLRSLSDGGLLASVGNASGNSFDGSVLPFIMRRAQMLGIVANAPWPQRRRLWDKLAGDWKPDFAALQPDVRFIGLDELLGHAARQLEGVTSGRTVVRFGAAKP